MNNTDLSSNDVITTNSIRGDVSMSWYNTNNGEYIPINSNHNTLTYGAADALAAAYGGDSSLVPRYMGFIYRPKVTDVAGNALDTSSVNISRLSSITSLGTELKSINAGLHIVDFSYRPTLSVDKGGIDSSIEYLSGDVYLNNVVTFHAHTVSGVKDYFDPENMEDLGDGSEILAAVLLGKLGDEYRVLAIISLKGNSDTFKSKPTGFELALDWKVTFF